MLFQNIMNSSDGRIAKQIIQQQNVYEVKGEFYHKVNEGARKL